MIDHILAQSNIGCRIGLTSTNTLYTWVGFCAALRDFNAIANEQDFFLGNSTAQGLVNIASLLAQSMWETGGVVPFSTCDESNYRDWPDAACTQRDDGVRYDSLSDQPWSCSVESNMQMTAVTYVAAYAAEPLECTPGTVTEGCCWWGRGAIQTTGPNNYGLLQQRVIGQISSLSTVDLCANPEAICENNHLAWLGAFFFWANDVQGASWPEQKARFDNSLAQYVANGFNLTASTYDGADFANGCGNVVNNGLWTATAHGHAGRVAYFNDIISMFTAAGMTAPSPGR